MKCFVINVVDQIARWEAMAAQFIDWPFPVERIDAVDGRRMTDAQVAALYSPSLNQKQSYQPLTPGEIGCYASHVAVWRGLLDSDERSVAIFEDDVTLQQGLPDVLRAVETLETDWGMLKLMGRRREKTAEACPWIPGFRLIRYRRVPSLCCAYVINRSGAQKVLSAHVPFGRPVDIDMRYWWESGCQILGVQPYPVTLSTLASKSIIGNRPALETVAAKLRRLRWRIDYSLKNWNASRLYRRSLPPLGVSVPSRAPT